MALMDSANHSNTGCAGSSSSHLGLHDKPGAPRRREQYDGGMVKPASRNTVTRRESNCQFPQMKEFSHFHYDQVELGAIKVMVQEYAKPETASLFALQVMSQERFWTVYRGVDHFLILDAYLHRCIYDRKISQLQDLTQAHRLREVELNDVLTGYLSRLSDVIETSGSMMNCGTALNFFELDNHGRRLVAAEDSAINIPAIAAAHCVHRYIAQASDELSLEVGDMVSVIDMPPLEDTNWWRGKKNFEVGLFPAECVEVIGGRTLPQQLLTAEQVRPGCFSSEDQAVLRRRGKLISFLRMFFSNRPQRSALKQSGIVKERVFGCDLGEHLLNSGLQVPYVLTSCIEFVETYGMLDGIYRLTGVTSNVQKLRFSFDEGAPIDLSQEEYLSDLHSVTAVLKMYFRELPNPLLTYQLYGDFAATLRYKDEERLRRLCDVVRRLPPPNYRTAKRLFGHLHKMSQSNTLTNMDTRNLAIVWAPNLMRCKALDNSGTNVSSMSVLNSVSLQATVTEFMISHADLIFGDDQAPSTNENTGTNRKPRPTSVILSPPGRLLSLAEAQGRLQQLQSKTGSCPQVELAAIALHVNPVYHTIIEFPGERGSSKLCISPMSSRRRLRSGNVKAKDKAVVAAATRWRAMFSKHAGVIGLKGKHKEKAKVAEDSAESEEDQQLSEIGHLSRQSQQGSLPSVKKAADEEVPGHKGRRIRLLSDHALLGADEDAPVATTIQHSSKAMESNLVRSSSHESFFDGEMASACTPGVVIRPAYKANTVSELVQPVPAPTWRRTTNLSKSPSPVLQTRIPYVPTPDVDGFSDKVQPYMLQQSPSVGRRSVMCFSSDADAPDLLPTVDFRSPRAASEQRGAGHPSGIAAGGSCASLSAAATAGRSDATRAGSLDQLSLADGCELGSSLPATAVAKASAGSSEQLRELMSHWESSDQLLVATQGQSARTCRQPPVHGRLSPPVPSPRLQLPLAALSAATSEERLLEQQFFDGRPNVAADAQRQMTLPDCVSSASDMPLAATGDAGMSPVTGQTQPAVAGQEAAAMALGAPFQNSNNSSNGVRWRRKHQQQPQLMQHGLPSMGAVDAAMIIQSPDDGTADPTASALSLTTATISVKPSPVMTAQESLVAVSARSPAIDDPSAETASNGLVDMKKCRRLDPASADFVSYPSSDCSNVTLQPPLLAPQATAGVVCSASASDQANGINSSCSSSNDDGACAGPVCDDVFLPTSCSSDAAVGPRESQPLQERPAVGREARSAPFLPAVDAAAECDDAPTAAAAPECFAAPVTPESLPLAPDVLAFRYETGTARRETLLAFSVPPPIQGGTEPALSCPHAASSDVARDVMAHDCAELGSPPSGSELAGDREARVSSSTKLPPRPPPRLSLQLSASSASSSDEAAPAGGDSDGIVKPLRRRRLPLPPPSDGADTSGEAIETRPTAAQSVSGADGGATLRASAVSPGQCAFRWVASPAAMELPSPASALAAEPTPASSVLRRAASAVATAAEGAELPTGACQQAMPPACREGSCSPRTSALFAAVMLEASKPATSGLAMLQSPLPVASPDIIDAFKAFSAV